MSNASDRRNSQPDKFDTGSNSNHCGQLWQARAILDEKVIYLIDWEGTDPETGRNYEPSWGERPTDALLSEWKQGRGSPTGRKRKKCSQWPSPVKNPRISAGSSSAVSTEKSSSLAAARGRTIEQASSGDVEEASSKPMPDASMHDNNTSNPHETNSDEQTSLRALLQQKVAIIKAMHEQISLERSKYHGMQGALPSLRKHIDKLKGRIAALQADLATSQRQKETGDTRITSLEDEIVLIKTHLAAARDLLISSTEREQLAEEKAKEALRTAETYENMNGTAIAENERLHGRLRILEKQASGIARAEMTLSDQNQGLKMRCDELESLLRMVDSSKLPPPAPKPVKLKPSSAEPIPGPKVTDSWDPIRSIWRI